MSSFTNKEPSRLDKDITFHPSWLLSLIVVLLFIVFVIQVVQMIPLLNPDYIENPFEYKPVSIVLPSFLTLVLLLFVLLVNRLFSFIGELSNEITFLKRKVKEISTIEDKNHR